MTHFGTNLDMSLINCEAYLILTWSRERVTTSMERRVITNTRSETSSTNATSQITDKVVHTICYFIN